jgi:hypothetical protein
VWTGEGLITFGMKKQRYDVSENQRTYDNNQENHKKFILSNKGNLSRFSFFRAARRSELHPKNTNQHNTTQTN